MRRLRNPGLDPAGECVECGKACGPGIGGRPCDYCDNVACDVHITKVPGTKHFVCPHCYNGLEKPSATTVAVCPMHNIQYQLISGKKWCWKCGSYRNPVKPGDQYDFCAKCGGAGCRNQDACPSCGYSREYGFSEGHVCHSWAESSRYFGEISADGNYDDDVVAGSIAQEYGLTPERVLEILHKWYPAGDMWRQGVADGWFNETFTTATCPKGHTVDSQGWCYKCGKYYSQKTKINPALLRDHPCQFCSAPTRMSCDVCWLPTCLEHVDQLDWAKMMDPTPPMYVCLKCSPMQKKERLNPSKARLPIGAEVVITVHDADNCVGQTGEDLFGATGKITEFIEDCNGAYYIKFDKQYAVKFGFGEAYVEASGVVPIRETGLDRSASVVLSDDRYGDEQYKFFSKPTRLSDLSFDTCPECGTKTTYFQGIDYCPACKKPACVTPAARKKYPRLNPMSSCQSCRGEGMVDNCPGCGQLVCARCLTVKKGKPVGCVRCKPGRRAVRSLRRSGRILRRANP